MKINTFAAFSEKSVLKPFTYERELEANKVVVSIKYCSCTRGDIRFIDNHWGDTQYPFVPGLEIIGIVEQIADGVIDISVGDVVGIGYQVASCFACEYCIAGKEQFCLQQKLIPIHDFGGFADKIIVDYRFVFPLPQNLRTAEATPLMCSGLTTYTAITSAQIQKDMNVGVIGIGSLGHLAVQFLSKMECHVTAFSHSSTKEDILYTLGAEEFILLSDIEQLKRLERKYDFILFTSTSMVDYNQFLKLLRPEGILCFVGLPEHEVTFKAELLADFARRSIKGNYIGSRQDMKEMLQFASEHNIIAKNKVFDMEDVNDAITAMRENKIAFSVVLENTKVLLS